MLDTFKEFKDLKNRAILLTNLGSPDSYEVKDVRTYLNEFLMDERVIDIAPFWRRILVKGLISPLRAPKSAAKYKTIWTENGSPLIYTSEQVQTKLEDRMRIPVELCMRYANPTPQKALDNLAALTPAIDEVILVPLYPHYAMSSYETAVEYVKEIYDKNDYPFSLKVLPPYYDDERYIDSLAESMRPFLEEPYDHLLFSYHGVPKRHILKGDCTGNHCFNTADCCNVESEAHAFCYRHQVLRTTDLVAEKLGIPADKYSFSFQSRLGPDEWLKPATANQLEEFPKQGIKNLVVVCPAFVSDCLETLEEIMDEGEEEFLEAGGEKYRVIPCLNERNDWIEALALMTEDVFNL